MANAVLVIGDSGAGKSTAIESLDPEKTFVIQAVKKDLPWKGSRTQYKDYPNGHKLYLPDLSKISANLKKIADHMNDIKTIIIDDANYLQAKMYLSKGSEKGYDKFTDIATYLSKLIEMSSELRDDLDIFFMWHSICDESGRIGLQTIGKFMDEKYKIEGAFTIVLYAEKEQSLRNGIKYHFVTGNKVNCIAKSPRGMFPDSIPNNLKTVKEKMYEYYNG